MLYNLRSDIIYYKSGSDFELEFNLCGCCRMRLLTDKPSNKKTFVHSLARAVARSRVILIAGPIFGEENTIQIVSQALGTSTEIVNNDAFNISSDEEIEIIKGSLPLVASDGSFGGCIIESGPQTMILLTDNKTLRKNIMTTLVHPYISDLYAAEVEGNAKEKNDDTIAEELLDANELILGQETEEANNDAVAENLENVDNTDDINLILPTNVEIPEKDINPEDIFFDEPSAESENEYEDNDITINDLFPADSELETPARTIEEKLDESQIILEVEADTKERDFPEEYNRVFNKLFTEVEQTEEPINTQFDESPEGYKFLNDDGEWLENSKLDLDENPPRLHIATIIFTVILFISIVVLCYCVFAASKTEGMAPTEYIRSVWQTVFG